MTDLHTAAMKLALEAAYLAGWNASGEGYNAEYPFGDHARNPEEDAAWIKDRDNALREALAEQPAQHECRCNQGQVCHVCDPIEQPAQQEPVAWAPYLSDRADGVKGHYAIARWNPRGYREVWNLRRHEWAAYSDDVLSLEEADTLLRLIEIPTRKVESRPQAREPEQPAQQREPVCIGYWNQKTGAYYKPDQVSAAHKKLIEDGILRRCYTSQPTAQPEQPAQEPAAIELLRYHLDAEGHMVQDRNGEWIEYEVFTDAIKPAQQEPVAWRIRCTDPMRDWVLMYRHPRTEEQFSNMEIQPLYTSPPAQRKPLTLGQKQRLWSGVGDKPTLKDRVNAYGLAIEAAHGIKENT